MARSIDLRMNNFRYDCEGVVFLIKSGILQEVLCYCNNKSAVKNDRTFWRITDLGKQALESGELKRAKKQIEALNLLLTQD